jgi:hypothetical protein
VTPPAVLFDDQLVSVSVDGSESRSDSGPPLLPLPSAHHTTDPMAQIADSSTYTEVDTACKTAPSALITSMATSVLSSNTPNEAAVRRGKPLELLDLPEDILQAILREVTHTNDLTALALTHSTLHDLVIPHIYSRFDIVWPEANGHVESRVGVDALTYGLSTLVMASDVFGETYQQHRYTTANQRPAARRDPRTIRRGNHFAQYTKKFSLGNGPSDWVNEYLITKEGGKMLGTLVALAIGRMRNLETFIWDMPTGVLRDIWLALASLGSRNDGQPCRLEKVWVRWHDNSEGSPLASSPQVSGPNNGTLPQSVPAILGGTASALFQIPPYPRVEFPTFSTLPPLKSLTVLDIDEMSYAEEMSVVIENSLHVIRELRVGIADHAQYDQWTMPFENRSLIPSPLAPQPPNLQRNGGILGILVHRYCGPSHYSRSVTAPLLQTHDADAAVATSVDDSSTLNKASDLALGGNDISQLNRLMTDHNIDDSPLLETPSIHVAKRRDPTQIDGKQTRHAAHAEAHKSCHRQMQLELLELERVYLSVPALSRGIDWTQLESITLLGCRNHEQLWSELIRRYAPPKRTRSSSSASRMTPSGTMSMFSPPGTSPASHTLLAEQYKLKIKRIHTDAVSPTLISFIKDALAPDSLEWLFLQENSTYKSTVTIDTIYKAAIRRHRGSLTKLLVDSGNRKSEDESSSGWKRWMFSRELLGCITSGRMRLRELSLSVAYKDWHYFLQRLQFLPTLRSLHIAHIADHVHRSFDSREAALQVLDIVSLRPTMELCYLGVQGQCFELLEGQTGNRGPSPQPLSVMNADNDLDSDDNDDMDDDDLDDGEDDLLHDSFEDETEDENAAETGKVGFRLREILFYDDKVSIFRARHGRL